MSNKVLEKNIKIYSPNYISKNLSKDEKILVAEQTCGWLYMPICFFVLIFFVFPLTTSHIASSNKDIGSLLCYLCAMLWCLWYWFYNKAIEMAVTNKRIILKKGIFIHQTNELRLEKVESVNIKKSLLGLIFGYGTIIFTGTGNQVVKFEGINSPQKIKNEIDEIFDKYRRL